MRTTAASLAWSRADAARLGAILVFLAVFAAAGPVAAAVAAASVWIVAGGIR